MFKALLFIFGGSALIYYSFFGGFNILHLPTIGDVADQYEIKKIKNENTTLKLKIQKMEFTIARFEEANQLKSESLNREIASEKKEFEIFSTEKNIKDYVQQDIYNWSPAKLHALAEKEYSLKNYVASSQYGLTLLNLDPKFDLIDENFQFKLGISCIESNTYINEGVKVLTMLVKNYPESMLVVKAKLWRGLAYHRLNNKEEFAAMMEEFKQKYRNTKEWNILKNIYERGIASESNEPKKEVHEK